MANSRVGGFALAVTIFALLLMAVLITGGFYLARQEAMIGSASENSTVAFYLAEGGINRVVAEWDVDEYSVLPLWGDTTIVRNTGQGRWAVKVTRMTDRLFFLESTGTASRGGVLLSGASRRIGTAVRMTVANLMPAAALVTRGATEVRAGAEVDGFDAIPPGWSAVCPSAPEHKPGIITDDASQVSSKGGGTITGDPPVLQDPTIADSTFTKFGDLLWDELVDLATIRLPGGAINNTYPDSTAAGECITTNPLNWGNPLDTDGACSDYFPIIYSSGPPLLIQSGGVGQGILLVDGDLDLRGNFVFHGLVIVRGILGTQGTGNRIYGAVMAGNANLDSQSLVGGSTITNSVCAVNRAVSHNLSLNRARPLPQRSWVDLSSTVAQE